MMSLFSGRSRLRQFLVLVSLIYVAFLVFFSTEDGVNTRSARSLREGTENLEGDTADEKHKKDILVIVMGQKALYPAWKQNLIHMDASVSLLYGSYDEAISETEWENDDGFECQTEFVPHTTWTEGRNQLAAEALRMEIRKKKEYDYWLFLDDDVGALCNNGEPIEKLLGGGSCWQKVFNFIGSDDLVPERASSISIGGNQDGFSAVSTMDAMFAAFKRSHIPYILPYATLPEGASEWTSQAALFCIMETCMRSSTVLIPYTGGFNPAHREYTRGLNYPEIMNVVASNYHDEVAGFLPCAGGFNINQFAEYVGPFPTKDALNEHIPIPEFEMCSPMKNRFEAWKNEIVAELEAYDELNDPSFSDDNDKTSAVNVLQRVAMDDILIMVMGEKNTFPTWLERLGMIETASLSLLFGSFDDEISPVACNNEYNLSCQVTFIPGSTWTQGRNLLAGEALRKEMRRGKKYDYWVFLDDDVDAICDSSGDQMERILGSGSCWQKIFNFITSEHVPDNASTVTLSRDSGVLGFEGVSTSDAMFAAFKRDRVPYLLPYVNLREGSSEWTSQASLSCIMQTCMKSSAVFVPFIGGQNSIHDRVHVRGNEIDQIIETIADNYHDEKAGFYPCTDMKLTHVKTGRDSTGVFHSGEELNERIPPQERKLCRPLTKRFERWERKQYMLEPLEGYIPTESEPANIAKYTWEHAKDVDILVIVMGEANIFPTWKQRLKDLKGSITLLFASFDKEIPGTGIGNELGFNYQTAYIPGTTWTEGRNLLAAEAIRMERRREKMYDYWLFLDDDVNAHCFGGIAMEDILGEGSCWQRVFNFISSDHVPENVSTISLPYGGNGMPGFAGFSNTDAMFTAFKRERVPYLLPYATLPEGSSEWLSQASLFCIIQTCMKSSTMLVPYVGGRNGVHRDYIRGLNLHEIRQTITNNYHDDQAGFFPCLELSNEQVQQGRDFTGTYESGEELNEHIPPPDLELCEPLRRRFEAWESQITI